MLQLLVALPSKRPALGPLPRTLANDRARFFAKKNKTNFSQKQGVCLEPPMAMTASQGVLGRRDFHNSLQTADPKAEGEQGEGSGSQ